MNANMVSVHLGTQSNYRLHTQQWFRSGENTGFLEISKMASTTV